MNSTTQNQLTFEEYKKYLSPYPIFGEMEVTTRKTDDGYEITVVDRDICTYVDKEGKSQTEDMSNKVVRMFTDESGTIGFIEHGYQAITKANRDLVIHTARFIGKQIVDIEKQIKEGE